MSISIQLDRSKKMVIIKLPIEKLRPSGTGKLTYSRAATDASQVKRGIAVGSLR